MSYLLSRSPGSGSLKNRHLLFLIILTSAVFHFASISYPPSPVSDEAHFATHASEYAQRKAHFDLHPPLGKLLYAGMLLTAPEQSREGMFVEVFNKDGFGASRTIPVAFESYPYIRLRILHALFGILVPVLMYALLRRLGISERAALLGTALAALENALLLQTRLITLDGMYLTFGFLALIAAVAGRISTTGIFLGLSLGVKLVGVVFFAPILAAVFLSRKTGNFVRATLRILAIALAVPAGLKVLGFIIIPAREHMQRLYDLGFVASPSLAGSSISFLDSFLSFLGVLVIDSLLSFTTYLGYAGGPASDLASAWYAWPVMSGIMPYVSIADGCLLLFAGNPIVWAYALLAVLAVPLLLYVRKRNRHEHEEESISAAAPLILLAGYAGSILPFATVIQRSAYIYHYLPSLLFGICLFAWLVDEATKLASLARYRRMIFLGAGAAAIIGFVTMLPFTHSWINHLLSLSC